MAISFGVSQLRAITNGIGTSTTTIDGSTGSAAVASGSVWIGGIECVLSAVDITIGSGADVNTGNMFIYAYLAAGQSSTATMDFATGSSLLVTNYPQVGTDIAVIAQGAFGTGGSEFSTGADISTSGLTGARAFGRAQNCNLNITYDNAMHRGGTLIFPNDIKHYNGNIEGTLEYANISGANLASIYGATWASGGAGSGTLTLTATQKPLPFMVETQQVTDGVTSTIRILKCYSNSLTLNIDRENFTIPSLAFQAIGNQEGDVITWNI